MIKILNSDNIVDLVLIENSCFSHPLSKTNISESINNEKYMFLGYKIDGRLIGYISVFIILDEAYINNIAVLKEFRKQGIGNKLVNEILEVCKNKSCKFVTLEVRESNFPAISLYEKLGFERITVRKNYYNEPIENAIIMTKYF